MQSCKTCPSFMTDDLAVSDRFGRAAGTAICGRFGHVLGTPVLGDDHNEAVWIDKGMSCESHGDPMPGVPVEIKPKIAMPDSDTINAGDTGARITTCNGCVNFVKPEVVNGTLGIPVGLCGAKGTLVFKPTASAAGCIYASPGRPSDTMIDTRRLLPEFRHGFTLSSDVVVDDIVAKGNTRVNPLDYVSDVPVSDADLKKGILAWRLVHDPEGEGDPVPLPIFNPDIFTDEEKLHIPQAGGPEAVDLYLDHAGLLYDFAVDSWDLDEVLCLVGEPGLGKTEFVRWVAWLCQVPFYRFSCHKGTEVDDAIGKIKFDTEQGTYWIDGRITKAYKSVCFFVVDELNLAPADLKEFLRSMMDNSRQLVLDQDEGLVVNRNPMGRMLVAINPPWDMRNLGAEEFADAETNRMSFSWVPYPPAAVEKQIIRERCLRDDYEIPEDKLDAIIAIAGDIREAAAQGTYPGSWGIRQQIKVARKTRRYGLPKAYRQAALNYYEPDVRDLVLSFVTAYASA